MKSFIMQPGFEESMKQVGKKNYKEIDENLNKLNNGMQDLLTEEQKRKYKFKV